MAQACAIPIYHMVSVLEASFFICAGYGGRVVVGKHENLVMPSHLEELVYALGKHVIKNVHHHLFCFYIFLHGTFTRLMLKNVYLRMYVNLQCTAMQ